MEILFIGVTYSKHTFIKCLSNAHVQKRNAAINLVHVIHGPALSSNSIPIIVLHGLLGSKKNWTSISKNLAATNNTTVVTPDMRNHGESPHETPHTYSELTSDVLLLMSKLKVDKAHIIGHSMGGRTAMVLALTQAAKVQSLLVLDISPVSSTGLRNSFVPRLLEGMKKINFSGIDASKAREYAKKQLMESRIVDHPALLSFVLMSLGKKKDGSAGWLINVDALHRHFPDIGTFPADMNGKTYDGPTLFIGGGESDYLPEYINRINQIRPLFGSEINMQSHRQTQSSIRIGLGMTSMMIGSNLDFFDHVYHHSRPEDLPGIKRFFPKVDLKYIKDVGHNVHAENPKVFLSMAKAFISSNK